LPLPGGCVPPANFFFKVKDRSLRWKETRKGNAQQIRGCRIGGIKGLRPYAELNLLE
jgi:hypothetical protein